MRIHRIRLKNYRGIGEAEITPSLNGVTIIQGPNEVGKSSLIEATDLIFRRKDRSSANRVEATQPQGRDVGPEVEIEISTGHYRFIYFKRWIKDEETRLEILAPEKEREKLTGDKAHERANQILEDTLHVDLWKALRVAQGTGLELPDLEDKAALSHALDEAAGGARIGEKEVSLYNVVKDQHNGLWRKNGEPRKPLQDQRGLVATLEDDVAKLESELQELQNDIERIEQIQGELEDLKEKEASFKQRRDELSEKLEEVEDLEQTVGGAKEDLERAEECLDRAQERREHRKNLIERMEEAREELDEAREDVEAHAPELEEAQEDLDQAKDEVHEAKEAHQEAARLERLRRKDRDHLQNERQLKSLRERREKVVQARSDLDEARQTLAGIAVDDEIVDEIRDRTYEVEAKKDRLEEGGPTLRLEPRTDLTVTVDQKERTLGEGEVLEEAVAEQVTVDVPDVLTLAVETGTSTEDLREELEEAQQELSDLLGEVGVDDLDDSIDQLRERNQAQNDKEHAKERMEDALNGLDADELEDKIASLEAEVDRYREQRSDDPPLPENLNEAKKEHSEVEQELEEAKETLDQAERREEAAREKLEEVRENNRDLETNVRIAKSEVDSLQQELEDAREGTPDKKLKEEIQEKEQAVREAREAYQEAKEELEEADPESVRAKAENAQDTYKRAVQEIDDLDQELIKRRTRVETKGGEGIYEQLDEKKLERENARRELDNMERRANAVQLLFKVLDEARSKAKQAYIQPLKKEMDGLGRIVYGSTFEVHVDEDLTIEGRTLNGTKLPFDDLSAGAKEQLGMILRLACAKIVAEEGDGVPLLIDDALGYSDPDRLEAMGAVLSSVADDYQLLVLTCMPDRYRHVGGADIERMG